jgi:CRISPR/Cas system CSM-associated protein Csm3 (group 7 of RAMP superfamily)
MTDRDRGRGAGQPSLRKPYAFVPLAQRVTRQEPAGHHRFQHINGRLDGVLVARSPVHVASGLLEPRTDRQYPLVKAQFRVNGQPAIPGTSLKGCIRSILEAISSSAVTATRAQIPREAQPSRANDNLDVAQRLFGAMGYQGQVRFSDVVAETDMLKIEPTTQLFRPRREALQAYYDGRQVKGRKFYMHGELAKGDLPLETCPVGTRFVFRVDFANLTAGELGLLLIALGLGEPRFWPKLGGGKPACLGTVEVVERTLSLDDDSHAAYKEFDLPDAAVTDSQPYLAAARTEQLVLDAPNQPQLRKLAEILRWPNEDDEGKKRNCPDRSY